MANKKQFENPPEIEPAAFKVIPSRGSIYFRSLGTSKLEPKMIIARIHFSLNS